MGPMEWGLLLALSAVWGGSYFFVEVALRELGPITTAFGRVTLAALVLHAVVRLSGGTMAQPWRLWLAFLGMGVLNNVIPFNLIVWGQTEISGALASILNATTPLFTVLVAHALTRDEKMTRGKLMGVLAGFAGVVVMVGPDALGGLGLSVAGQLACLAAALSYAFAGVYGRRFKGTPPLVTACGQVTASSLVMAPMAFAVERPWTLWPFAWETVGALAGVAVLSTALGYWMYFRILRAAGATNLLLVTFL
ncbi:MAG: DMT family transporter, partial [Alphaproteobacteria bacterium]|nr:DMT family transporter [Alphaproteobacteria bacterium]